MITSYFHGQLGNNLFQLAALLSYKEKGKEIFLTDSVNRGTVDQINNFFIHPKRLEFKDMFEYKFPFLDHEIFESMKTNFKIYNAPDVSPSGFFGFSNLPMEEFIILNGYFQSEKYFKDFEEKLKNLYFKPSKNIVEKFFKYDFKDSVSIHVRRGGDRHLGNMQEYFKDLDFSYYQNAINIINNQKQIKKIFIFSDDISWCEKHINNLVTINKEIIFIKGNKNYEDLFLMSKCENNIIGNSTFSWWAAWLNTNQEKVVIAPKNNWFGPNLNHLYLGDLFPNNWVLQ
jgi:hypothetical protein